MVPMSLVDPAFAKSQLLLLLSDRYQHPNGQVLVSQDHLNLGLLIAQIFHIFCSFINTMSPALKIANHIFVTHKRVFT